MKRKLLKSLLAIAMLCVGNGSVWADETELAPVGVFTWTNAPAITYDGDATSWAINQGGISGGNIGRYAGPYAIIKFDASTTLEGMTLISATLDFDITAGGYNSSINIAQMSDATFTPSTVTTETFNKAATQFQSGGWSDKNSTKHFSYDVKARVVANNVLAFAIYTNTAREQTLKNVKLKLNYSSSVADYTINYKDGEEVVKTVRSSEAEGNTITALTAIDGEGDYAGNHYLITAAEAPSMVLDGDAENILEVPVRAPYTATLRVTTTIGGTPSVVDTPLTETDGKVCSWSFAYPKYAAKDGIYYLCDASTFVQSGTFSDDEIVERTVTYTTPDVSVVGFSEIGSGTNGVYSNGGYTVTNSQLATATVDAGNYIAYISVIGKGGSGSNYRQEGVVVGGEQVANTTGNTTGLKSLSFTVSENNTEVYVKGNGTSNYTDELDYVLIRRVDIADGTYYLKNKATGAYFAAGLNYGTKAMTNTIGHTVTLSQQSLGYNIDTKISNGGNNHYLNGVWTDGAASIWDFLSDGDGYYAINNGTGNLTAGAVGAEISIALSVADYAKWQLLTEAEWKAEQEARLDAATASNGVDATFYIPAAKFNRNDNTENNKWQGSPTINGLSENSANTNFNAEKYTDPYDTFDVYQALTGLKPGAYKLTAQGFYRNGLDNELEDNLAMLYANDVTKPLLNININAFTDNSHISEGFTTEKSGYYVPDGQVDASKAFNAGYYNNELFVVVGEDGELRLGVKKTAATGPDQDWAVFDNFQLTYYGTTCPVTLGELGWATLYTPYPLDFEGTGLTAYTATLGEGIITLTEVSNVPANTGVVLNGEAGSYNIPTLVSSETAKGALTGNATESTAYNAVANHTYYVLAPSEDPNFKVQFRPVTSGSIAAGKAFLDVAGAGVKAFSVKFADADAIRSIENESSMFNVESSKVYNLAGQRMSKLQKGINILNGKKVLVK